AGVVADNHPGVFGLERAGGPIEPPFPELGGDRLFDEGMGMAEDERAVCHTAIDEILAVNRGDPAPLCRLRIERTGLNSPDRTAHPAGHQHPGLFEIITALHLATPPHPRHSR